MSRAMFKVSVFMITYNHENYIRKALDSILCQQVNFDYEIVVGEDLSSDGTRNILLEYKERYPDRFKLILHQQRMGAPTNQVITMANCTGKYIAMLEGDDYWSDEHKLQKQIDFLEANPEYVLCFHKIMIDKDGVLTDDYLTKVPFETSLQEHLFPTNYIHTLSVVYRNNIRRLPSWFNKALPGDYPLWLMVTNDGGKIKYLDDCMGVYRVHGTGIWTSGGQQKAQKINTTLLRCAQYINCRNQLFMKKRIIELSQSVYAQGYKDISWFGYISIAWWVFKRTSLSNKQRIQILTPLIRKFKNRFFNKAVNIKTVGN